MGKLLKPTKPEVRKAPSGDRNEVWTFHVSKSGIKKYVPIRK